MKGLAVITLFWGVMMMIVWGVLAVILTGVFTLVAPSFDSTYQLFIIAMIPSIAIALIWGIFGNLNQ